MGSLLFAIAKYFQMIMPMSLQESGMFILFVLVAPITEELLFRYSFSVLLKEFPLKPIYRMLIISLLFSWMHFFIYFYVSPLMKSFVLYQSIYAFFMGFWWHYRFEKSNNLVEVIILHMVFSLGFWLTSFA
jgi:membrane protease YdiL (CAAX protease family)